MATRKYKIIINYIPTNTPIIDGTLTFSEKGTNNSLQNFHIGYKDTLTGKVSTLIIYTDDRLFEITTEILKLSTLVIEPVDSLPYVDIFNEIC